LIAGEIGVAHSTVHAILKRHGRSRTPRAPREQFRRYEWPCPGDLLHMDVKRYPRFQRPGHAVTGDRSKTAAEKRAPLGHDYFHAVVDDHTRLVYGELLTDERAPTTTAFFERALAWFAGHGISARSGDKGSRKALRESQRLPEQPSDEDYWKKEENAPQQRRLDHAEG